MSNGKPKSGKEKQKSSICVQLLKALFCTHFKLFNVVLIFIENRL